MFLRAHLSKKELLAIIMVLAFGCYLSFKLQSFVLNKELERKITEFESTVSHYTISLQHALNHHQNILKQFSDFHASHLSFPGYEITQQDLALFIKDSQNTKAIYFLQPNGINNDERVIYIPELFQASNDKIHSKMFTIDYTLKGQNASITSPFLDNTVAIASPISINLDEAPTKSQAPYGFFVSEIDMDSLAQELIGSVIPEWLDIHLYITKDRVHKNILAFSGQGLEIEKVDPDSVDNEYSVFIPSSLNLDQLKLSILFLPDQIQLFNISDWQRYSTFTIGFTLTFILCIYLVTQKSREHKINNLVQERTRDLKVSAERLDIARKEQQTIFDSVPAQIWYKDLHNKIIKVNQHAADYVGMNVEDMTGVDILDFLPKQAARETPGEELPKLGTVVRQINQHKKKIWLQVDKVPIRDDANKITGIIILCMDITELKNITDALFESEQRFQLAVEGTNDGIWDWPDMRKDIQYWSPHTYELLGYKESEIISSNSQFLELIHQDDLQNIIDARENHIQQGIAYSIDYRLRTKNNGYRWFNSKGKATQHENGTLRMTGSLSDIHDLITAQDEKSKMEEQLQQAQKLESIGQLAAGIAHEINTPIQFIGDNLQFIKESLSDILSIIDHTDQTLTTANDKPNPIQIIQAEISSKKAEVDLPYLIDETPNALSQSLDGIDRVSQIVKAMKEFSHPSTENKAYTDLNKAISSTIIVSKSEWKLVADIETDFDKNLPDVECFPGEFNQTILNTIVNAAHAIADVASDNTNHQGLIKISTRKQGENAVITISDNGKGMPEHVRKRIFDPFFTTKEVGKGTGQGLSIAYSVITEKHSGSIDVTSEEGQGTTFTISLPIDAPKNDSNNTEIIKIKKIA